MKNILLIIAVLTLFIAACNTKPKEPTVEQLQAQKDSIEKAAEQRRLDSLDKLDIKYIEDRLAALNAEEQKLKAETDKLPADKKAKADKYWDEILDLLDKKDEAADREIDSLKKEIESLTKK